MYRKPKKREGPSVIEPLVIEITGPLEEKQKINLSSNIGQTKDLDRTGCFSTEIGQIESLSRNSSRSDFSGQDIVRLDLFNNDSTDSSDIEDEFDEVVCNKIDDLIKDSISLTTISCNQLGSNESSKEVDHEFLKTWKPS